MDAYFFLLFIVYICFFFTRFVSSSSVSSNNKFLVISFLVIYAFCALRDYSVGRDIPGYMDIYEKAGYFPFMDKTWTYMEIGYVTFMQLCSLFELSDRMYFCIVYALMLYPIYRTIKTCSQDPLLSVIIFICFQFLTFDLSGIRQGLAMSFCLMSLEYAKLQKKRDFVYFYCLILLAYLFHRSSLIFILVPFVLRLKLNVRSIIVFIVSMFIAPFLTKPLISLNSNNELSGYSFDDRLKMGGMLVLLFLILLFMLYSSAKNRSYVFSGGEILFSVEQYTLILMTGIFFSLAFNGTMLGRSTMYYTIFVVYAIPNAIKQYKTSSQIVFRIVIHLVMLVFFYQFCLVPKVLDTVPYKLGTDLPF